MIILYIIIGYLLVTFVALALDIATNVLTMCRCKTIKDLLDEVDPVAFIPIVNIACCLSSIIVFLFMLLYKLYKYINVHWNKILKIKIVKKKRKINQKEEL
jgi:hypothetical protein